MQHTQIVSFELIDCINVNNNMCQYTNIIFINVLKGRKKNRRNNYVLEQDERNEMKVKKGREKDKINFNEILERSK